MGGSDTERKSNKKEKKTKKAGLFSKKPKDDDLPEKGKVIG